MSGDKAVLILIHTKRVGWGCGQGSMWALLLTPALLKLKKKNRGLDQLMETALDKNT